MECVEQSNGGYYVAGTRVSLDSVVYASRRGESPAQIAFEYEALTTEQIEGAIAFYLANRPAIDEYLRQSEIEYDRLYEQARTADPLFYAMLDAREDTLSKRH